jgi:hypothetical protein
MSTVRIEKGEAFASRIHHMTARVAVWHVSPLGGHIAG